MKKFVEYRLFTKYHDLDDEVVRRASELNLYLIGGTAIEIWLNHLRLKGWRKRSDNDLDFISIKETDRRILLKQLEFGTWLNKEVLNEGVQVDILLIDDKYKVSKYLFEEVQGIKVMHPYFLFHSKYDRLRRLDSNKDKERFEKDIKDLKDILKIINKIDRGFGKFIKYINGLKVPMNFINALISEIK